MDQISTWSTSSDLVSVDHCGVWRTPAESVSTTAPSMAETQRMSQDVTDQDVGCETLSPMKEEGCWVFDQGSWKKDRALGGEICKSSWDEVFINDELKKGLRSDVEGFFYSENAYKNMSVPWKRGLILYGPPGNGKTITLKCIMKTCRDRGVTPLYVTSFNGSQDTESNGISAVFEMARKLSPCAVVFENLEGLVDGRNCSSFLKELDGITNNQGLLFIGATNHLDLLHPTLSDRPGRFDRKYHFQIPGDVERLNYIYHWISKLEEIAIHMPVGSVEEIAWLTHSFSFAYINEAFVSSMVLWNGIDRKNPHFSTMLKGQISTLRQQMNPVQALSHGYTHSVNNITNLRRTSFTQSLTSRKLEEIQVIQNDGATPHMEATRLFRSEKCQIIHDLHHECACPSAVDTVHDSKTKESGSIVVGFIDIMSGKTPTRAPWADEALFVFIIILSIWLLTYLR